jgi:hypothetical protein
VGAYLDDDETTDCEALLILPSEALLNLLLLATLTAEVLLCLVLLAALTVLLLLRLL